MSEDIQKTALRLPRELHTAIHEAAKESGRTMNAEIVYRLEKSFPENTVLHKPVTEDEIRNEYLDILVYERYLKDLASRPFPDGISGSDLKNEKLRRDAEKEQLEKQLSEKRALLSGLMTRLRDQ